MAGIKDDIKTKLLLFCGAIACPLFILVFLIEGAVRKDYNPLKYPISSLAIGESGWIQTSNFIVTGLLIFAFAIGLQRILKDIKSISRLIGLTGIGLIGAGIFTTDPVYGYPENLPLVMAQFSVHGKLHDAFSILVLICLPAACFVTSKRFTGTNQQMWATYSAISGIGMTVAFVLAGMGFKQIINLVNFAGVLQRICILFGSAWLTLLALHFLKFKEPHS